MNLVFEIAGDQIDGARDYQEDAFLITYLDDEVGGSKAAALVIMADGMGGHAAGNIASNLVVSTFNKSFTGGFGKSEPPPLLRQSLDKANDALKDSIRETPALDGMGCTMVTAAFSRAKVYWVSVGDSHMYLIRDRELSKKNEDHSYGGYLDRMQAQGMDVEAEAGLSRNMLMSAMTGDEIAEVDCPDSGFQLLPGDRVVVASDGLDTLTESVILQTSTWSQTPKECVQALLAAVEEAKKPRQDNTTVIVCDVTKRESPVAPPAAAEERPKSDSQPLDMNEITDALARERDATADQPEAGPSRGKGALIAVIAAVVLIAGAAGAWFMLGGKLDLGAARPRPTSEPVAQPEPRPVPEPVAPEPAPQPVAQPEPAAPAQVVEFRDALRSGGEGPAMIRVPAGTFQMGSSGLSVEADERPRHEVKVREFAIGKYEVTFAEYDRFAKATGRASPDNMSLDRETHPVVFVTWDDAYAYTQWLANETGERYRLPSEAEWEFASSAGVSSPFWWGFEIGQNRAHCFDCETGLNPRQPTRTGRFEPNAFGVHDTSGNVAEWVHDCYHASYEGAPGHSGPWEGGDCSSRMVRGGAYTNTSKQIRSASREKFPSQQGYDSIGFRVARDL